MFGSLFRCPGVQPLGNETLFLLGLVETRVSRGAIIVKLLRFLLPAAAIESAWGR